MFFLKKRKKLLSKKIRIYEHSNTEYYAYLEETFAIKSWFKTKVITEQKILRSFILEYGHVISYNLKEKNKYYKYNFNKPDWCSLLPPESAYDSVLSFPIKNSKDLRSLVLDYLDKYPLSEKEYIDKEISILEEKNRIEKEKSIRLSKELSDSSSSGNLSLIE